MTEKHFANVNLTEFEPDTDGQQVITDYVDGRPWVLVAKTVDEAGNIDLHVEGGGGMTLEQLVPTLASAALAVNQGYQEAPELLE